jgi:hypothetical protein
MSSVAHHVRQAMIWRLTFAPWNAADHFAGSPTNSPSAAKEVSPEMLGR